MRDLAEALARALRSEFARFAYFRAIIASTTIAVIISRTLPRIPWASHVAALKEANQLTSPSASFSISQLLKRRVCPSPFTLPKRAVPEV